MSIISEVFWFTGLSLLAMQASPRCTIEVTETDQTTFRADLTGFSGDSIHVLKMLSGESRKIPFENILRLRFTTSTKPAPPKTEASMIVELRGGSRIVSSDFTSDGKNVAIASGIGPLEFASKAVSTCLFGKLSAELLPQWKTFVESQVSSDMLVLARSDESLDKIEGLIGKVTSEFVVFDVDGQSVEAPREKLAGIKYFSTDSVLLPLAGVVRDVHRNEWIISSITSEGEACTLKLNCGESVTIQMSDLAEIDLSYGNSRYIADMEPIERTSLPRFELAIELADAAKLFGARKIEAPSGPGLKGPSVEFVGAGSATFRVPTGFTKLVGTVEMKPGGQAFMACRAAVMLESNVLWEHNFEATRQPQEISLAVESDKRLRLIVESKADHPLGDVILWNQLRLLK